MYPASCCTDTPHATSAIFRNPAYTRHASATEDTIPKKSVNDALSTCT